MTLLSRFGAVAALTVAVFVVVGCGETVIDSAKTEAAIEQNLENSVGQTIKSVDCPSGVEVKAGTTFDCTVSMAGGKQETATLKIINSDADVEVTNLKANK